MIEPIIIKSVCCFNGFLRAVTHTFHTAFAFNGPKHSIVNLLLLLEQNMFFHIKPHKSQSDDAMNDFAKKYLPKKNIRNCYRCNNGVLNNIV